MTLMTLEGYIRKVLIEQDEICKNCFMHDIYYRFNGIHQFPEGFKCGQGAAYIYCPMYGKRMPFLDKADGMFVDVEKLEGSS